MEIVVGTAGHIDHGKTSVVRALTGVETDRLPEEKQRGISIDLGFAQLSAGGFSFGFVDVPGHERFVKNMLAGATGIDLVMLVVAADEAVMPQTREHFDICRLLGVTSGLVAISKTDMVDAETLELAHLDVSELVSGTFLEGSPIVDVSSKTGSGLDVLMAALTDAAMTVRRANDVSVARLPVDRSFTVKGFGTVVTGTLVSGELATGDELEIQPIGRRVRVRGLETQGEQVDKARRGSRVAVNLAAIGREDIERGMSLTEAGSIATTQMIDAEIEVLKDAKNGLHSRRRVRVNIGTAEVLARLSVLNGEDEIVPGSSDLVQVRFESPIATLPSERFIIRSYSPAVTIAGGRVITNSAEKHRKKDIGAVREGLERLRSKLDEPEGYLGALIELSDIRGLGYEQLQKRTGYRMSVLRPLVEAEAKRGSIVDCGGHVVDAGRFSVLKQSVIAELETYHRREPLSKGMPLDLLRESALRHRAPQLIRAVIDALTAEGLVTIAGEVARLTSHQKDLSPEESAAAESLRTTYRAAGVEVPRTGDAIRDAAVTSGMTSDQASKVLSLLVDGGELVKVSDEFYYLSETVNDLAEKLREQVREKGDPIIDVPKFKELAGVSRKYAIPLLEYFDRAQVTRRAGDKRVILR